MMIRGLAAATYMTITLFGIGGANAADLKVLSASGFMPVFREVAPRFERATGHKLAVTHAAAGTAVKRVLSGEAFDVIILPSQGADILAKGAKIDSTDVFPVARSGIGVAVRKGAPKPDISSPEALKRALLSAESITYSNPDSGAASGIHFAKVLERLGIFDDMGPKTVFDYRTNAVGVTVAEGGAEIGVHQLQELIAIPGIDLVGPLPDDLQATIVFVAGVTNSAKEKAAAKAFIDYLRTQEVVAVIRDKGMKSD